MTETMHPTTRIIRDVNRATDAARSRAATQAKRIHEATKTGELPDTKLLFRAAQTAELVETFEHAEQLLADAGEGIDAQTEAVEKLRDRYVLFLVNADFTTSDETGEYRAAAELLKTIRNAARA